MQKKILCVLSETVQEVDRLHLLTTISNPMPKHRLKEKSIINFSVNNSETFLHFKHSKEKYREEELNFLLRRNFRV
jgi:hypothetical protein